MGPKIITAMRQVACTGAASGASSLILQHRVMTRAVIASLLLPPLPGAVTAVTAVTITQFPAAADTADFPGCCSS